MKKTVCNNKRANYKNQKCPWASGSVYWLKQMATIRPSPSWLTSNENPGTCLDNCKRRKMPNQKYLPSPSLLSPRWQPTPLPELFEVDRYVNAITQENCEPIIHAREAIFPNIPDKFQQRWAYYTTLNGTDTPDQTCCPAGLHKWFTLQSYSTNLSFRMSP